MRPTMISCEVLNVTCELLVGQDIETSPGLSDRITSMYSELANDLQQRASRSVVWLLVLAVLPSPLQELVFQFSGQAMYDDLQQTKNSLQSSAQGFKGVCWMTRLVQAASTRMS